MLQWLQHSDAPTLSLYALYGQVAGMVVGSLLGALLADWFGRKKPMFVYFSLMLVFHLLTGVALSWTAFLALRVIVGCSAGNRSYEQ